MDTPSSKGIGLKWITWIRPPFSNQGSAKKLSLTGNEYFVNFTKDGLQVVPFLRT